MRRRLTVAALGFAILLGVISAGSVVRVPTGQIAATSTGWLRPGLRLRAPFARVARIAAEGRLEVGPLETVTTGGAARRITVGFRYSIGDSADRSVASAVVRGGLAAGLEPVLRGALQGARAAPASSVTARTGTAADELGKALVAALASRGVLAEDLEWHRVLAGPGPAISPLPPPARRRVLIVGLDAADWQIAGPLMRDGRLPNLARLVREGTSGPLRSYDPMMSPLIWTTMVTGVGPDLHGIADFTVTDAATGRQIPITSRFRKVKALWNILSDAGLSSGFAGWWASYPAEPVRGWLVTDLLGFSMNQRRAAARPPVEGVTWPDGYYAEVRPRLVLPEQIGWEETARLLHVTRAEFDGAVEVVPPEHPAPGEKIPPQNPVWQARKVLAMTHNYETIGLDLLGREIDVVGVYFEGIDMMGHRFEHCMAPRMTLCPDAEYEESRDAVESFYVIQDEVLGRLVSAAKGRTVVVVSDHGFRNGSDRPPDLLPFTTGQPVEWHREEGIVALAGPGIRRGASLSGASVYDIAPTLLYLSGLPASEEMRGRVLESALTPADLERWPPRRIPSYEEVGPPRTISMAAVSPEAQQEMIENLRALGYVGGVPETGGDASSQALERSVQPASDVPRPGAEAGVPSTFPAAEAGGSGESARVTYHRNLATFYLKQGRADEAESELRKANALTPLPKTYELLSEIRASKGDIEGAVSYLEEGLAKFPEMDEEAVLWMVDLRLGAARADLASQTLDRWRGRVKRPAVLAACEGKIALARGDEATAIRKLLEALSLEPALSQAALAAAPLLDSRGRLAELEAPLSRALAAERRLDEYQNLLGLIRLRQGRAGEAAEAIGRALDVSPADARYLENYAASALAVGRLEPALVRYRAALALPGAGGALWAGYGRLLGVSRRPQEASTAFEKAISLGDRSPTTYAGYATSLLQSGRRDRAREVLGEGLRAYPGDSILESMRRRIG